MENYVVTFARGFGTGGKEIASKLAKELGIHCYENRILTLASQMSGLDEKLFQEVNEKVRSNGGFSSFLKGLPRAKSALAMTIWGGIYHFNDSLYGRQVRRRARHASPLLFHTYRSSGQMSFSAEKTGRFSGKKFQKALAFRVFQCYNKDNL